MPINEILAPYYLVVSYTTWAASHKVRIYLTSGSVSSSGGVYTHTALEDAAKNPTGSVSEYVRILFQLVYQNRTLLVPSVDSIEVWQSQTGPNTLLGYSDPIQPSGGSVEGAASGYVMLSGVAISGSNRQRWRLTLFEAAVGTNPQRFAGNAIALPAIQDYWDYLLASMVTQDGYGPIIIRSTNVGYNRKLARRYGRILQP